MSEPRILGMPPIKIEGQPDPGDDPERWERLTDEAVADNGVDAVIAAANAGEPIVYKWPFSTTGVLLCNKWREHLSGCECQRALRGVAIMLPEWNATESGPSATKVGVWLTPGDLVGTPYKIVLRDNVPQGNEIEPGHRVGDRR